MPFIVFANKLFIYIISIFSKDVIKMAKETVKTFIIVQNVLKNNNNFNILIIIIITTRAGRYDQKCISRYFSKLYRFHGI